MNKLKKWYSENKDKPLFKAKLLLAFLILFAVIVQIYYSVTEKNDTPEINESTVISEEAEEPEKEDLVLEVFENSKAHIVAFLGVTAALAFVKYKQKQKIKESG